MKNLYKIGDVLKPIDRSMCVTYEEQNAVAIRITDINSDGNYFYVILSKEGTVLGGCSHCFKDDNLTLVAKTLNTLQVGDYIQNKGGDYKRVLAVLNRGDEDGLCVYVMSTYGEKDSADMSMSNNSWTVLDLKISGYSIEEEDPTPEIVEGCKWKKRKNYHPTPETVEELIAAIREAELVGIEVSAILAMIRHLKKRV